MDNFSDKTLEQIEQEYLQTVSYKVMNREWFNATRYPVRPAVLGAVLDAGADEAERVVEWRFWRVVGSG